MSTETDGTLGFSRENLRAALREVVLSESITRGEVASRIGVKVGTVSRIARSLIDAGLMSERMEEPGERPVRPGRRLRPLSINPRGGYVLGIGISPGIQAIALADIGRNIIEGMELRIEPIEDADHVIRRIVQESRDLVGKHLSDRSRLLGGLLMITATVDPKQKGDILEAPYL